MRNWKTLLLLSVGLFSMSGCAAHYENSCVGFLPIRPSQQDVLTDGTVKQILSHNQFGEKICGWVRK